MARLFFLFPKILIILFSFFPSPGTAGENILYLRLENQRTNKIMLEVPIKPGDLFFYDYIHSSDHTPVKDTFRAEKDGKMILIEEAYLWYGAGLEFQGQQKAKIIYEGPWTKVQLKRVFYNLPLRIGRINHQKLLIHDHSYALTQFGEPGDCLFLHLTKKEKNGQRAATYLPAY